MLFSLLTLALLCAGSRAESLGSYNVDIKETSVSGLSAGGFFAVQMQVAFSSFIKGAGIVAGGPYDCAGDQMYFNCMYMMSPTITHSESNTDKWSGSGIDDITNMKKQKVYIISGTLDTTVGQSVVKQLYAYESKYVDAANIVFNKELPTAHTFPTDFDSSGNNGCSLAGSPYVSNCHFDGAGAILKHIYGDLKPRTESPAGKLHQFSQSDYISSPLSHGMDSNGYLYVPAACEAGEACRLHVALHGCLQSYHHIDLKFVEHTGYTKWADTNNIIVLFPQAYPDNMIHFTKANSMLPNPNACWDWVGWYGADFQQKSGVQMAAIKKMIDKITSGAKPNQTTKAPEHNPTDVTKNPNDHVLSENCLKQCINACSGSQIPTFFRR